MSPDHWSNLTWDTVSAGGYDLFGSNRLLGPDTRPCVQTESHSYSRHLCPPFPLSLYSRVFPHVIPVSRFFPLYGIPYVVPNTTYTLFYFASPFLSLYVPSPSLYASLFPSLGIFHYASPVSLPIYHVYDSDDIFLSSRCIIISLWIVAETS